MQITRHPDQDAKLKSRVATGDFASVEDAALRFIDEALAEVERGEVMAPAAARRAPRLGRAFAFVSLRHTS